MTIINQLTTTIIADNTTYTRAHGQLYWFFCRSIDHFLCVSHAECVNFIITKSKHRKGNFISACCHCLCFEIMYERGSVCWEQQFWGRVHLKMFVNQKDFSPHSVDCALTAQGGEADFKFTEMSTLVWSDFDLKLWKKNTAQKIHCLPFQDWNFCSSLITVVFVFFAFFCGKKHVYINCELSIPHTFWPCYLISGKVSESVSNVFVCISLKAIFYLYICTTCHNPSVSPVLFSWPFSLWELTKALLSGQLVNQLYPWRVVTKRNDMKVILISPFLSPMFVCTLTPCYSQLATNCSVWRYLNALHVFFYQ